MKAAIDRVARMSDILELADFAADPRQPPEARMFAANKVEAEYELAAEERRNRPMIDLDRVRATVAGLDSLEWRDPGVRHGFRSRRRAARGAVAGPGVAGEPEAEILLAKLDEFTAELPRFRPRLPHLVAGRGQRR